jgi:hypothetical protein
MCEAVSECFASLIQDLEIRSNRSYFCSSVIKPTFELKARVLVVPHGASITAVPDNVNQRIQPTICMSLRFRQASLSFRQGSVRLRKLGKSVFVLYLEINQVLYLVIMFSQIAAHPQPCVKEEQSDSF